MAEVVRATVCAAEAMLQAAPGVGGFYGGTGVPAVAVSRRTQARLEAGEECGRAASSAADDSQLGFKGGLGRSLIVERAQWRAVKARARNISHNVHCTKCESQSIEDS